MTIPFYGGFGAAMLSGVPGKTLTGSKCPGPASLGAWVSCLDLDGWCHYRHAIPR